MNRIVTALLALSVAPAAQAAEYMQKTPFQMSRASCWIISIPFGFNLITSYLIGMPLITSC